MSYPSDISTKQWKLIKGYFKCGKYGNRRKYSKRTLVNAVFYITKTGCQWRQLPSNFPPWKTVYSFFMRAKVQGTWEKIMESLVEKSRVGMGKAPKPKYSLIDSQSVKTTSAAKERGIDGGKKNKGLKKAHCH
ncbi:transposase [Rickettsiella endosymbiont of Dermanyssus gallinae]|uniref:transposase n=1 Tax=Rickettsiella endosymbiont of Dermanyssus gallinae TaxID=2856608 RepID=UPI001C530393|nr:transposase [Rickettsiella endosymbiont of Dermanyssus gallinae]